MEHAEIIEKMKDIFRKNPKLSDLKVGRELGVTDDYIIKHRKKLGYTRNKKGKVNIDIIDEMKGRNAIKRREKLAEIIKEDLVPNFKNIAKKFKVNSSTILYDFKVLVESGDQNAIMRNNLMVKKRADKKAQYITVKQYMIENPRSSNHEIAGALGISFDEAVYTTRQIVTKEPGSVEFRTISTPKVIRMKKIAEYFSDVRTARNTKQKAAKDLGVSYHTLLSDIRELNDQANKYHVDTQSFMRDMFFKMIMTKIAECDEKFRGCKSATQGARWIELQLQAIRDAAKMFGLTGPEVAAQINFFSKEQNDLAVDALKKTLEFDNKFQLMKPINKLGDINASTPN